MRIQLQIHPVSAESSNMKTRIKVRGRKATHASLSASAATKTALTALTLLALSLHDDEFPFSEQGMPKIFNTVKVDAAMQFSAWSKELRSAFVRAANEFKAEDYNFRSDTAVEMSKALRQALPKIKADIQNVTPEEAAYFGKLATFFNKDSAPAWRYIVNNVKMLQLPTLNKAFVPLVDTVQTAVDLGPIDTSRMKELVKKMTKRPDTVIHSIEGTELRKKYPKSMAEYTLLYKAFNIKYKAELKKLVMASGQERLPIDFVSKKLAALGCDNTAKGYKGLIDADNNYYTPEGKQLGASMVGKIEPNPEYDPETDDTYVARSVGKGSTGRAVEYRTKAFTHNKAMQRHNTVATAAMGIAKLRSKWAADLRKDGSQEQVIAALIETAYTTLARVGGVGNKTSEGVATYGLSTLLVEHVKVDTKGAHFDYAGKKGTEQPATLFPRDPVMKKTIQVIKQLTEGKAKKDLLFTHNGNRIKAQQANAYLRSLGFPQGFSIHKFRHLAGTKMFQDIVKDAPFVKGNAKTTQAAVERWYKSAMIPIGVALHHRTGEKVTGMTAIGAYISIQPQKDFFADLGLHAPSFLKKKSA